MNNVSSSSSTRYSGGSTPNGGNSPIQEISPHGRITTSTRSRAPPSLEFPTSPSDGSTVYCLQCDPKTRSCCHASFQLPRAAVYTPQYENNWRPNSISFPGPSQCPPQFAGTCRQQSFVPAFQPQPLCVARAHPQNHNYVCDPKLVLSALLHPRFGGDNRSRCISWINRGCISLINRLL